MNKAIQLVIWDAAEAGARQKQLESLGYTVRSDRPTGPAWLRSLGEGPPGAVVIDLSRAPSTGRDIALAIRSRKATRQVPILFTGAEPEKAAAIGKLLPDARFTTWDEIGEALRQAGTPTETRPVSVMAGYAGVSLVRKLTIKAGTKVALLGEPPGFRNRLDIDDVQWVERPDERCALTIWFVHSALELESEIGWITAAGAKALWIAWGKGGSVKPAMIRAAAKEQSLAEYKICSIDGTWSALLFTKRAAD